LAEVENLTPCRKEHLEMKLDTAGIEWSASDKQWDGLSAYERKLSNAPKEKGGTFLLQDEP